MRAAERRLSSFYIVCAIIVNMSSDLYDSEDKLAKGSCSLAMNVHGSLFLSCDEDSDIDNMSASSAQCVFASDSLGIAEAEKLAAALLEWAQYCKSSQ